MRVSGFSSQPAIMQLINFHHDCTPDYGENQISTSTEYKTIEQGYRCVHGFEMRVQTAVVTRPAFQVVTQMLPNTSPMSMTVKHCTIHAHIRNRTD